MRVHRRLCLHEARTRLRYVHRADEQTVELAQKAQRDEDEHEKADPVAPRERPCRGRAGR